MIRCQIIIRKIIGATGTITARRMKQIFIFGMVLSTFSFFVNLKKSKYYRYSNFCESGVSDDNDCYESDLNGTSFTIQTEGCTIPFLKPIDYKIKKFIDQPTVPECNKTSLVLLEHNETQIWIKNLYDFNESETVTCCYRSFYRPKSIENIDENVDDRVKYNECINFNDTINVQHEFVKVNCSLVNKHIKSYYLLEEYFLFARKKKFIVHDNHREISNDTTAFNILVLGIDSVSRLNFFRTMPKTVKYLLDNKAVDLSGYNKVGDNTYPNLIPMLLGVSETESKNMCLPHKDSKFDNCPFIWEQFKQAGYYTAFAEDSGWLGTFNFNRPGFSITPTDYYTHTFMSEAEKYVLKEYDSIQSKPCLNNRYFYQVLLDYVHDLTRVLRDKKFFGLFWEITMSHDFLNNPMLMDKEYIKLFEKLETTGYLNDSIVFLLSDHGIRWGDIRYTKQGRLEESLPFVFILLPQRFRENYSIAYQNLKINSKRLTTPYDIHSTLYDLANLANVENEKILLRSKQSYYKSRSISLFLPIPTNRTCELAGISDHWCTCLKRIARSKNNKVVWRAAINLVERLNARVTVYKHCANLSLVDVIEANELVIGKPESEEVDSWRELMVVVKTMPGDGVFEATLRGDKKGIGWTIVGTVSRLNLYGNQSHCITDNALKLYCYCK